MTSTLVSQSSAVKPQIAIIIPVFKHSVLVGEAISCALEQKTTFPFSIVIVNDGCPFTETDRICRDFALAYPDKVFYIYRQNGGLSAARNTGINFALETWTSVEAIYLLDSDNRISPITIDRTFKMLLDDPEVGWIYPTINMFGQEYNGEYRGEYSVLRHLRFNICEAGSMVKRAVFEAGCRYDELMKLGYEDWEFWWQAIDAGFRGKHCPEFGFKYRKRFESMLKNTDRDREGVLHYMQRKHKSLFKHSRVMGLEHEEAPRYAIFLADTEQIVFTSDPTNLDKSIGFEDFREIYLRANATPVRYYRPHFLVFTRREILNCLNQYGLTRWLFWRLESIQDTTNFATVLIDAKASDSNSAIAFYENEPEFYKWLQERDCHLAMSTVNIFDAALKDAKEDWIQSIITNNPMPKLYNMRLEVPGDDVAERIGGGALLKLLYVFKDLRSGKLHVNPHKPWNIYNQFMPPRSSMFQDARWALESGPIYPIIDKNKRKNIGFILPIVEFGGVEKVALNIARVFYDAGWQVHLFVINNQIGNLPEWAKIFTTINFINEDNMYSWNGSRYMGTRIDQWSETGNHKAVVGLFSWLNVIVNFHSVAAHSLMGVLRRAGVKTIVSLHVHDLSPWGRPNGFSHNALGYEHAYDFFMPCSQQMEDWCHAIGIPQDKLVVVPNACGYPLPTDIVEAILTRRWQRSPRDKIKVVFIGRFDRQKGLDRLVDIVLESKYQELPIEWRLVGKSIVHNENASHELEAFADLIEPPALNTESLNEIYEWADVLLLPSYWEGLPLTVIEAMRLGVIVCASNVGAMSEIVEHNQTGFLIPDLVGNAYTETVLDYLAQLSENPEVLKKMSQKASLTAAQRSWVNACSQLLERLELALK